MLKKNKLLFLLFILLNFNKANSYDQEKIAVALAGTTMYMGIGCLITAPFFYQYHQANCEAKKLSTLKNEELHKYLIDFFSNQGDGFQFIEKLNEDKDYQKTLKNFQTVAVNRINDFSKMNYGLCKCYWYVHLCAYIIMALAANIS